MKRLASKAIAAGATIVGSSIAFATTVAAQRYTYDYTYNSADAAAATGLLSVFGGAYFLYICCICCIPLLISLAIFIFIYKDTQKYNVENGLLWAIFGLTWVGLLIYLLAVRQDAIREFEKNHGGKVHTPNPEKATVTPVKKSEPVEELEETEE